MNRVVVRSKVDADGILRVAAPLGPAEADREVQVTIEPLAAPRMTQDEWREFIRSTAGSIADPTFIRHPQGDHAP
jgi:hypothetical protein